MTRTPRTPAQQLHQDAVRYARQANRWTAQRLRLQQQGHAVEAWDARMMAASYRARIRTCAAFQPRARHGVSA